MRARSDVASGASALGVAIMTKEVGGIKGGKGIGLPPFPITLSGGRTDICSAFKLLDEVTPTYTRVYHLVARECICTQAPQGNS